MAAPFRSLSLNDIEAYMRCGDNPDRMKKAIADAMDLTEFTYDPLQAATIDLVMQTLDRFNSVAMTPHKMWVLMGVVTRLVSMCQEGRTLPEICAEWHDAMIDEGIYELDEIKHLTHVIAHTLFKNADLYAVLFKTLPRTDPVVESIDIEIEQPCPPPPLSYGKEAPNEETIEDANGTDVETR